MFLWVHCRDLDVVVTWFPGSLEVTISMFLASSHLFLVNAVACLNTHAIVRTPRETTPFSKPSVLRPDDALGLLLKQLHV
jgi:hypothetical protein